MNKIEQLREELGRMKLDDLAAVNTFQDIKSFLLLIEQAMEDKGTTDHQFYKIAKKLDVSVRALEQHYSDNLDKLAKLTRFNFE